MQQTEPTQTLGLPCIIYYLLYYLGFALYYLLSISTVTKAKLQPQH